MAGTPKKKILNKTELERLYWDEGLRLEQVGKKLGVSTATVYNRMKDYGIPRRSCSNPEPNLEPTPTLSYILGVLHGDGCVCVSHHHYSIVLRVRERAFAESFAQSLREIGLRPHNGGVRERSMHSGFRGCSPLGFHVSAKNKHFALWFKSLTLVKVGGMFATPESMNSFLRGYYESDGTVVKDRQIQINGTNLPLLGLCQEFLRKLGYEKSRIILSKILPSGKKFYRLYIGGKNQVSRFFKEVNPVIKMGIHHASCQESNPERGSFP